MPDNKNNPLLASFDTPFESIPFSALEQTFFEPAILQAIEEAKQEVENIIRNPEDPSFYNTIAALERAGRRLHLIAGIFFNLNAAETNDYLQNLAQVLSPLLAEYANDVTLNSKLFERVKRVFEAIDKSALTVEEMRLLDKIYTNFTRNGALLDEDQKERLRTIDKELASLKVNFSQNVLQETNAYSLHLTEEEEVLGLPESIISTASEEAERRELDGWVFTLQHPSLIPFMKYASNRALREKLYLASAKKAFQPNAFNNEENIKRLVMLRQERAQLLGYAHHAAFVLQERMAENAEEVERFLYDLLEKAKPFARREIDELKALAKKDGIETMMPYDHAYYAEKLREEKYDLSEEKLKPYFPLKQVIGAAFNVANWLYGLTFIKKDNIQTYHEEVAVYEVCENGEHKALLYTDWHPRAGKRAGAWMTSYRGQYKEGNKNLRPHVSIVCNFSRPTADLPSLLTFNEVTTLFHEFGHALHGILADTVYESLSSPNVYWDFVELPSQFMENYCYDHDFLNSFAKHYATGESLPEVELEKIVASSNFMEGYQTLRQLSFGLLDMAYHTNRFKLDEGIEQFEKELTKETNLYPALAGTALSPSFSHIFPGGYASGYYSYKWAEVLDADAFAYFKETGIFNAQTAQKFKTLLSKGGTEDPMQLYINFRGRKPEADALLKRAGLIE